MYIIVCNSQYYILLPWTVYVTMLSYLYRHSSPTTGTNPSQDSHCETSGSSSPYFWRLPSKEGCSRIYWFLFSSVQNKMLALIATLFGMNTCITGRRPDGNRQSEPIEAPLVLDAFFKYIKSHVCSHIQHYLI